MNRQEYMKVKDLTYNDYCDYLQNKYGIGLSDYMTKSFYKNPKVSRTKDGLFAHHKAEDKVILLSTRVYAELCPFEWQQKENIVYCDYLEHLYLHMLICEYPSPEKWGMTPITEENIRLFQQGLKKFEISKEAENKFEVGIGGIISFLVPKLNDIYSGWIPNTKWEKNCVNKIINDKEVYLILVKRFIHENINGFDINTLLKSFNEPYGLWKSENNQEIFKEIEMLYKAEVR